MDSTKIPITKNVLDTSIHYICTNNLKLSSLQILLERYAYSEIGGTFILV